MAVSTEAGTAAESVTVDMEVEDGGDEPVSETSQLRPAVGYRAPTAFYLSPNTRRMRLWESFVVITVIASLCIEVFMPAFDTTIIVLWILSYFFDVVFLIDIFLRFFLAYMIDGILITDLKKIIRHYLRTTFILDFYSVLPVDLLVFVHPGVDADEVWRWLAIYRCINRLVRAHRLLSYFGKYFLFQVLI